MNRPDRAGLRGGVKRWAAAALLLLPPASAAACAGPAPPPVAEVPRSTHAPAAAGESAPVTVPRFDAPGGSTAGQRRPTRGNAVFPYRGGPHGKALAVSLTCRGEGTVVIDLPAVSASLSHPCEDGETSSYHDELSLGNGHRPGTVVVRASPSVLWSAAVGRVDAAGEDREP